MHFHVCAVDGVFEEAAGEGDADAHAQARAPGVIFHPATGVNADAVAQVQASLHKRNLRAFVGRGLLEGFEAKEMLGYRCAKQHSEPGGKLHGKRAPRRTRSPSEASEALRSTLCGKGWPSGKRDSSPGRGPPNCAR